MKFAFWKFLQTQFFLQLMKFAFLEVPAIHSILQRFATFCNVIATFAGISFIFATFLHCNYWQNALSSPILFTAFIMQSNANKMVK